MKFKILSIALLCALFHLSTANTTMDVEISYTKDNCVCNRTETDNANTLIAKSETKICESGCFELVFLIDGREARGTNELSSDEVFDIVKEWITRLVTQVKDVTDSHDNFLVVIQYAHTSVLSLATDLEQSFEKLREKIQAIERIDGGDVNENDSPVQLKDAMKSLVDVYNKPDATIIGDDEAKEKWASVREKDECKRILFTFTHGYVISKPDDSVLNEINKIFDRTDVVTVVYRPHSYNTDNALESVKLLQSSNGITYEYADYIRLIDGVDEVQRHICDPMPSNYKPVCNVELVFMVDGTHCKCNNKRRRTFEDIRKYVNEIADSYRSDKELILGKGFGLGLHSFYEVDGELQYEHLFNVDHYENDDKISTTSLDEFRAAVSNFNERKAPFKDLAVDAEQIGAVPLHKIVGDADKFFTKNFKNAQNSEGPTKIMVILKSASTKPVELGERLMAQTKALEQKYENNINIITIPIKTDKSKSDSSEMDMLNAVVDNPTPEDLTVLDSSGSYSVYLTASFEQILSRIETCADNQWYGNIHGNDLKVTEYVCECPLNVTIVTETCSIGDRGNKGPVGDIGDDGDKGNPGIAGKDGRDGKNGKNGQDGDIGDDGPEGEKGDDGHRGDKGPDGQRGKTGLAGKQGARGDTEYYDWEEVKVFVDENCKCSNSCSGRKSDWFDSYIDPKEDVGNVRDYYGIVENGNK